MEDKVTLDRIKLLHPSLVNEVEFIYKAQIVPALSGRAICRFAFTLRTFKEQDDLYAQGRTKLFDSAGHRLGIVTKAKGGQSYHQYGLALDIVLILDSKTASWDQTIDFDKDGKSDWMEVVEIFKKNKWEWGGDWRFKDTPHFQKIGTHTWQDLLAKYNAKDFIPGTQYVKLK
jgi:peptidoglycan L-alanyl-D-glutamate endopeptidase CwlK